MDILIVDNNDHYCRDLQNKLSELGCKTRIAHDPVKALSLVAEYKPDKVVIEQQLADYNSLELIEQISRLDRQIRIVVLSRSACLADAVKAIKLGAYNYLPRPIDGPTLLQSFEAGSATTKKNGHTKQKPMSIKRFEWEYIHTVLENNKGNISAAARELGINRRTLQRKLKKYPALN